MFVFFSPHFCLFLQRGPVTFSYAVLTPYQHVGSPSRTGAEGEFFSYAALWEDEATRQWKSLTALLLLLLSCAARPQVVLQDTRRSSFQLEAFCSVLSSWVCLFCLFCFSPPLASELSTEPCRSETIGDLALCLPPPSKKNPSFHIWLIVDIL